MQLSCCWRHKGEVGTFCDQTLFYVLHLQNISPNCPYYYVNSLSLFFFWLYCSWLNSGQLNFGLCVLSSIFDLNKTLNSSKMKLGFKCFFLGLVLKLACYCLKGLQIKKKNSKVQLFFSKLGKVFSYCLNPRIQSKIIELHVQVTGKQ